MGGDQVRTAVPVEIPRCQRYGDEIHPIVRGGRKVSSPAPTGPSRRRKPVGSDQVEAAIPVHIPTATDQAQGLPQVARRAEGAVAPPQQDRHIIGPRPLAVTRSRRRSP